MSSGGNILIRVPGEKIVAITPSRRPYFSLIKPKSIAISMLGTTTKPIMNVIKPALEKRGYEVLTFHANGTGGDCMDTLISEGYFAGVPDFSTNELVANNFGGLHVAKLCRMEAALEMGVPTVVTPGAANIIVLSSEEARQSKFDGRRK